MSENRKSKKRKIQELLQDLLENSKNIGQFRARGALRYFRLAISFLVKGLGCRWTKNYPGKISYFKRL
ncbi:unnamed protein product [Acanthoscelides obtectus]|uniref:Uncharacterized protein n=1 Tax=Acanthoscelides obtectus TaxID=200917 RepID=A0A9P0K539_ACAOB|nr:unnamed protein product [Acanthoscelides obtectus]CAK1622706.1 hypothetical protein AOBTE_LOCUS1633 [Acanthoscelides obtectus]